MYQYKLFWKGKAQEGIENNDNLDTEFSSSAKIEIGHHIEQVHCIAEVKSILHNKFNDEVQLVVEAMCTVEEYGIRSY